MEICGKRWLQAGALTAPERTSCGALLPDSGCVASALLRACRTCAGDYEDPDRTAGEPDEEGDEDEPRRREDAPGAGGEEFPAEEG